VEAVLVKTTNSLLLGKVAAKSNSKFWDQVTKERHRWDEMLDKQADPARSKDRIHPQAVARSVGDLAKRDAVFVLDTGLNTLWSANWIHQSGSQRIILCLRERYRLPKELPPRLLKFVRKLEAVEGNQELSPSLSTLFSKLDALEGNQLLRACRKHLQG